MTRRPKRSSVRANDGSTDAADTSVHIAMTITGNCEGVREGITFLYEDLVPDTPTGRIKVNAMYPGKGFDGGIFFQVLFCLVLDIVIESEDDLLWIVYAGCTDGLKSSKDVGS